MVPETTFSQFILMPFLVDLGGSKRVFSRDSQGDLGLIDSQSRILHRLELSAAGSSRPVFKHGQVRRRVVKQCDRTADQRRLNVPHASVAQLPQMLLDLELSSVAFG